jgi:hypothetical protein
MPALLFQWIQWFQRAVKELMVAGKSGPRCQRQTRGKCSLCSRIPAWQIRIQKAENNSHENKFKQ